jgi:site-specific recombinase XerD
MMEIKLQEHELETSIDWLNHFKEFLIRSGKSPYTIKAYLFDMKKFVEWFEETNGEKFIPEYLTNIDLKTYRNYCLDQLRLKPASWNRKRATLYVFWCWARKNNYIQINYDVFEGVNKVGQVKQSPRWLNNKNYLRFMRQIEKSISMAYTEKARVQAIRDRAMIGLMIWAGLREGEVADLELQDIEISDRKGKIVIRKGKGWKNRSVPLNNDARCVLNEWIKIRPSGQKLFIGKQGKPLGVRGIQRRVKEIAIQAKLEHITPHQLRHTFCKRMIDANGAILGDGALVVVAELAGHASLDTTRRYVQPGNDDLTAALSRL